MLILPQNLQQDQLQSVQPLLIPRTQRKLWLFFLTKHSLIYYYVNALAIGIYTFFYNVICMITNKKYIESHDKAANDITSLDNFLNNPQFNETIYLNHACLIKWYRNPETGTRDLIGVDPITGNILTGVYNLQTQPFPPEILQKIYDNMGCVLITHQHADHFDPKTLQAIIQARAAQNKKIVFIVPLGLTSAVKKLANNHPNTVTIQEIDWYQGVTIDGKTDIKQEVKLSNNVDPISIQVQNQKRSGTEIYALPVNHWSNGFTGCNGYVIVDHDSKICTYVMGDTALMDKPELQAIVNKLMNVIGCNYKLDIIIPSGPNYPRDLMKPTHASTVEAILIAIQLNNMLKNNTDLLLSTTYTLYHHKSYKLGPDKYRTTEEIIIQMLAYLQHLQNPDGKEPPKIESFVKKDLDSYLGTDSLKIGKSSVLMDFINQVHVPEKGMKITSKQVGNIALIQNAVPKLLEKRKPFKQSILSRLFNKQLLQQRHK